MLEDRRLISMAEARIVLRQAEFGRRQAYLDEGATSLESWTLRTSRSRYLPRSYSQVADKSEGLPHLMGAMCAGEISFDKVRTVVDVATPRNDRELCAQAKELSVRELAEVARTTAARARSAFVSPSRSEHDCRYLRLNPQHRTMTVQLPSEDYARTKACVDAFAAGVSSEEPGLAPPVRKKRPSTSGAATGSWDHLLGHSGPWGHPASPTTSTSTTETSTTGTPPRRPHPAPPARSSWWPMCPGGPGRRDRGQERAGGRTRAPWPDRRRNGPAHRL